MADTQRPWVITSGLDVIGADGEKLGEVQEVTDTAFIIKPGWLVPEAPSVSLTAITHVDPQAVYLTVTKEEVLTHGWDMVPTADRHAGTTADDLHDTTDLSDDDSAPVP